MHGSCQICVNPKCIDMAIAAVQRSTSLLKVLRVRPSKRKRRRGNAPTTSNIDTKLLDFAESLADFIANCSSSSFPGLRTFVRTILGARQIGVKYGLETIKLFETFIETELMKMMRMACSTREPFQHLLHCNMNREEDNPKLPVIIVQTPNQ